MNISKHWEKNIVHARGLFLTFCMSYIIGDIIAVSGSWLSTLMIFVSIATLMFSFSRWRIIIICSILWVILGYAYWYMSYAHTIETLHAMEDDIHIFEWKKYIRGTIDARLFTKERSATYRLIIATLDSGSTQHISLPLGKYSIFVEIPSNLRLNAWDMIAFTGRVSKNIHFPIIGYERYALSNWWFWSVFVPMFERMGRWERWLLIRIRSYCIDTFRSGFPRDVSWILLGMVIGVDQYLESDVKDAFMKSGITHILVVSGSNIAFLILFLMFFLKYTLITRWWRIGIVGSVIILYGFLVGWEVSVVRATLMGILSYFIAEYGWRVSSIATLVWAGFLLTLYSPLSPLYDAGFWLSFGATAGIFIFREPLRNLWEKTRFPPSWLPFFSLSLGATLWSLPILIYHFWSLSIGSIVINILIESVLWWILFTSVLYIPLSFVSPGLAYYFGYLIYLPSKYILLLSSFFSLSYTLIIPDTVRAPIALCLLGIYSFLLLEKDLFSQ